MFYSALSTSASADRTAFYDPRPEGTPPYHNKSANMVSAPSSARAVLEAYWQIYYIRVLAQSASGGIGSSRCGEVHLSMGVFEILLGGKHASELVKTEASNVTSAQAFFLLLI